MMPDVMMLPNPKLALSVSLWYLNYHSQEIRFT